MKIKNILWFDISLWPPCATVVSIYHWLFVTCKVSIFQKFKSKYYDFKSFCHWKWLYWCLCRYLRLVLVIRTSKNFSNVDVQGVPPKNMAVAFLLISHIKLYIYRSTRPVLKSTETQLFKTVSTFEFWPSRSWDIRG